MSKSLLEKFESYGTFWLPGKDAEAVTGQLKFDPKESFELILAEHLIDKGNPFQSPLGDERFPILHGRLINGTPITLIDGMLSSRKLGFGSGGPTFVSIHKAFLGVHLDSISDLRILSFRTSFTLMEEWAGHTNLTSELLQRKDIDVREGLNVYYRYPTKDIFHIEKSNIDIAIEQQLNTHSERQEFTLTPLTLFEVAASTPLDEDTTNIIKWNLQNLITLLTGYVVAPRFIDLTIDKPDPVMRTDTSRVDILGVHTAKKPNRDAFGLQMLAPYQYIKANFTTILNRWFDRVNVSKVALDVAFGSLYQPASVLNLRFLTIVQSLESYHRSLGVGVYMDQGQYDGLIATFKTHIPTEIQDDHRNSLKNRLKYGNEFSLRKRLSLLIDSLPENVAKRITVRKSEFIHYVVETRNQFTHYNNTPGEAVLTGAQLHWMSERLRVLLSAVLLMDIGIGGEELWGCLQRHNGYQFIMDSDVPFAAEPIQ